MPSKIIIIMSKSFNEQTNCIDESLNQFINGAKNRSGLCLVTNAKEWRAWFPTSTEDEDRLMRALASDKRLFQIFNRIVEPVQRYYRREARKAAKKAS